MTMPKNRSNSVRKIKRRTPQGSAVHFRRRVKGGKHSCALCAKPLQATHSTARMAKSSRTPNRKFAGHLCHACTARVFVFAQRVKEGTMQQSDLDVSFAPYVKPLLK